jgi:hypothetical protein
VSARRAQGPPPRIPDHLTIWGPFLLQNPQEPPKATTDHLGLVTDHLTPGSQMVRWSARACARDGRPLAESDRRVVEDAASRPPASSPPSHGGILTTPTGGQPEYRRPGAGCLLVDVDNVPSRSECDRCRLRNLRRSSILGGFASRRSPRLPRRPAISATSPKCAASRSPHAGRRRARSRGERHRGAAYTPAAPAVGCPNPHPASRAVARPSDSGKTHSSHRKGA